jgi:hypothetical protein
MPDPIGIAKKRLLAIKVEMAEIEQFIRMYEALSAGKVGGEVGVNVGDLDEKLSPTIRAVDNGDNFSGRRDRMGSKPGELARLMERLIRETGRPMTRGEIVAAFERRDVEIPGKDKARYLGTIAWRHKGTFVNIEGRGYFLRDLLDRAQAIPTPDNEIEEPELGDYH